MINLFNSKTLILASHNVQNLSGAASDRALHVIREIRLEHPHPPPRVIGNDVSDEVALCARVHLLETPWIERIARGVPSVNVRLTLVAEEEGASVVRAQDDHLSRFHAEIMDPPSRGAVSKMLRSYREHTTAAQVGED